MNITLPTNVYDKRAAKMLKDYVKKVKRCRTSLYFLTGKKKRNNITDVTGSSIVVETDAGRKQFSLSFKKIQEAISFIFSKRIVSRKELEKYSNFNSALMGLLEAVLFEVARIQKSVKGVLQIRMIGVKFFFSGMDKCTNADFQTVVYNGGTAVLCTYFHLRAKGKGLDPFMERLRKSGLKLLVDSGAFSLFNAAEKGKKVVDHNTYNSFTAKQRKEMNIVKDITVEEYALTLNKYSDLIYGFFNLDVIGDTEASNRNFQRLKELTGRSPIPVWHCDVHDWKKSDFESLDAMVNEDYEIIALGATVMLGKNAGPANQNKVKEELFKEIFNKYADQCFHWLGGSSDLLLKFPFFSADSSGWIQGRKINQIYSFEETSTERMDDWSQERCIAYNVYSLSSLEYIPEGIQGSLLFNEFKTEKKNKETELGHQLELEFGF